MHATRAWIRTSLLALALGGCGRACGSDHPYVPYAIDEAGATSAGDDAGAISFDAGRKFATREAQAAPPNATKLGVDGLEIAAPADRVIVAGLVADVDADGMREATALVRRADGTGGEELLLYRGAAGNTLAAPSVLATSPAAPDPTCAPVSRLALVGPRSIAAEVGYACAEHQPPVPSRWLTIVAARAQPKVQLAVTLLDPPMAPKMTVDADGTDIDGDGVDDVALHVTIEGGSPPFEPGPKVTAIARWLDRTVGMSRAPDEPDASIRALAGGAMVRAARAKDAPSVPIFVAQVRSLWRAMCGAPARIVDASGAGAIACGTSRGLEDANLAEVRALAVAGDPLRAITAFDRAQLPPASKTPARTTEAQAWIAQAAPLTPAISVRVIAAVPAIDRGHAPSWGALAFEPTGKLLVRTPAGAVRVDPAQGDEAAADDVHAWPSAVTSPDGSLRFVEAYDACDGLALHATFAPTGESDPRDVVLPIAPPLSSRCKGSKGEPVPTVPVAWSARGLETLVAGEPVLVAPDLTRASISPSSLGQPFTPGAPRSPSGRASVFATSQGLLVRGARSRLFKAPELEGGYLELRDCAVSDDATRIACVRGGRAFAGIWPAE